MNEKPATPKQIAFLKFMGHTDTDRLTREEASQAIEALSNVSDLREYERVDKRKSEWIRQRFILHPDLYSHELSETLHSFVRSRMTGASESLTKTKISQVISTLSREDADWVKDISFKERFRSKLTEMHPGCCDGQLKENKERPSVKSMSAPAPAPKPGRSGCLVMVIIILTASTAIGLLMK